MLAPRAKLRSRVGPKLADSAAKGGGAILHDATITGCAIDLTGAVKDSFTIQVP